MLTNSLQERCSWSKMFSQFTSATVIHALWQYDCTKHCEGCLVTGKRYLKEGQINEWEAPVSWPGGGKERRILCTR